MRHWADSLDGRSVWQLSTVWQYVVVCKQLLLNFFVLYRSSRHHGTECQKLTADLQAAANLQNELAVKRTNNVGLLFGRDSVAGGGKLK